MDALIAHPHWGSQWMDDAKLVDMWEVPLEADEVLDPLEPRWLVYGKVWEEISGFNIPDGGPYGEWLPMTVPLSLVRRLDPDHEEVTR